MITREKLVYASIRQWLVAHGHTVLWLSEQVGVSYPTMLHVLIGRTKCNKTVQFRVAEIIEENPWTRFPLQDYHIEDSENADSTAWTALQIAWAKQPCNGRIARGFASGTAQNRDNVAKEVWGGCYSEGGWRGSEEVQCLIFMKYYRKFKQNTFAWNFIWTWYEHIRWKLEFVLF